MDEAAKLLIVGNEGDLPIDLETTLLNVLQDREVRRVDGEEIKAMKRRTFVRACPVLPVGATGNRGRPADLGGLRWKQGRGRKMAGHRREINLGQNERRWFSAIVTPQETP